MNWNNKEKIRAALLDMAAFLLLCLAGIGLLTMMSGCTTAKAKTIDNSVVTTEVTRTEFAPDGSVAAIEVHKEVVKNDVVVEPDVVKEKKKSSSGIWAFVIFIICLIIILASLYALFKYQVERNNL